jgi:PEP-CTERM motif
MTSLFSGLNLNPGTYYVVLQWENIPGLTSWIGEVSPPFNLVNPVDVMVTTASGFTVGPHGGASLADLTVFPPSADLYASGPPDYFIFKVEGTVVPLPPTMWLLGSSLLGLAGWRRFRKG